MHDLFRETPLFEEAFHEGIEKGQLQALNDFVVTIVARRFPDLAPLAKSHVARWQERAHLERLLDSLLMAHDEQEAEILLLDEQQKAKE